MEIQPGKRGTVITGAHNVIPPFLSEGSFIRMKDAWVETGESLTFFQPNDFVLYERVTSTKPFKSMLLPAQVTHLSKQLVGIEIKTLDGKSIKKTVKAKYLRKLTVKK